MMLAFFLAVLFGIFLATTEIGRGLLMVLLIAAAWVVVWAYSQPPVPH